MSETALTPGLEVVPSEDPNVFNLAHEGTYIGVLACDGSNLTSKAPWGWRLSVGHGVGTLPPTGTSASIEEAIAQAERALRRTTTRR